MGSVRSERLSTTSVCQVLEENKHPHMFVVPKATLVYGQREESEITHEERVATTKIPPKGPKAGNLWSGAWWNYKRRNAQGKKGWCCCYGCG